MGMFSNRHDADQRLREARRALEDNTERERRAGITGETDEFNDLNDAVHAAEQNASWWARVNQ